MTGQEAEITDDDAGPASPAGTGQVAGELPGVEVDPGFGKLKIEGIGDSDTKGLNPMVPPQVTQWRWICYSDAEAFRTDSLIGLDLIVTAAPIAFDSGELEEFVVQGRPARMGTRYLGDGVSGPALVVSLWPDAVVEVRAHAADARPEDLLAVAAALRPLSVEDWRTRVKEYSYPTRDASADPQSTRMELGRHRTEGVEWEAALLVPPNWRTNPNDQRQACLLVTHAGVVLPENSCGDPWTIRLSNGVRFVFGLAGAGVESVTLASASTSQSAVAVTFEQQVPTLPATEGVRAYVGVIPPEQCYLTLVGSDRWQPASIIRPLGKNGFADSCALGGPGAPLPAPSPGTIPIGTIPIGTMPLGTMPLGTVPSGTVPVGTIVSD